MTPPQPASPPPHRFFPEDEPGLVALLEGYLSELRDSLKRRDPEGRARALALGGGYGRGEGGVFRDPERPGPSLYNDIEFYLFVDRAPAESLRRWAHESETLGYRQLGIDAEIRITPMSWLRDSGPSMFLYDLIQGHRIVAGSADFLAVHKQGRLGDASRIPLHEATRLLFNRGTGLLLAGFQLEGLDPFEVGFVARNHAKLKLGLGDALLTAAGQYHWSCLERDRRLRAGVIADPPEPFAEILDLHTQGVEFKLTPSHPRIDLDEWRRRHWALARAWRRVFLWVERRRLGEPFPDLVSYANAKRRLLPELGLAGAIQRRLRDTLHHKERLPRWNDHPRAVLFRALAAFFSGAGDDLNPTAAANILGTQGVESTRQAYRRWWSRYG